MQPHNPTKANEESQPKRRAGFADWLRRLLGESVGLWLWGFPLAFVAGIAAILMFGAWDWKVIGFGIVLIFASTLAGGLPGLLFAIPRSVADPTVSALVPNTNLEQVSDWLTKVLLGVGLVQLSRLPTALDSLGEFLAPGLGDSTASKPLAICIVVLGTITGFIYFYVWSRYNLSRLLRDVDISRQAETPNGVRSPTPSADGPPDHDHDGDEDL